LAAGGSDRQETCRAGSPGGLSLCFPGELRQAFALESSPHFLGIECEPTCPHAGTDLRIVED